MVGKPSSPTTSAVFIMASMKSDSTRRGSWLERDALTGQTVHDTAGSCMRPRSSVGCHDMPSNTRILAFSGSLRTDSWNHRVVEIAAASARDAGAEVTILRLRDHPLPLYDGDLEQEEGLPPQAVELKGLFREHDGFLIASPEYNGSYSGALKNTVDWLTRPQEGYPGLDCFHGKVAGLLSCSPGRLGGIRGLPHLRQLLSGIGTMVLARQIAIPLITDELGETTTLRTEAMQQGVERLGQELVEVITAMKSSSSS